MLTPKKSKFSDFILGKGFYAMLAVCLTGVGIAAWVAIDRTIGALSPSGSDYELSWEYSSSDTTGVGGNISDIPKDPQSSLENSSSSYDPPSQSSATDENSQNSEAFVPSQTTPVYTLPVSGDIILDFSNGELIKNETLNEWRTHNGVDIKAELGATVYSCAAGTVVDVFQDTLWGNAVEILHADGVSSFYYGLSDDVQVTVDEVVRGGEVIGYVGESNCAELAMASHLHFEMSKDGNLIDPLSKITEE